MAFQQLHWGTLQEAIQTVLENNLPDTIKVFDKPDPNFTTDHVFCEVVGKVRTPNKSMYLQEHTVFIHAIAFNNRPDGTVIGGKMPIYDVVYQIETAMTEDIILPQCFELIDQYENQVITSVQDDDEAHHVVLAYNFKVNYGYMTK